MTPEDAEMLSEEESARLRRDWKLFGALVFLFSFGFSVYNGVFQNFMRDALRVDPLGFGRLESLREIPGLLAALMGGTLVALAEAHVAGLGLMIAAIGIGVTGLVGDYWSLVAVTVFWSIGFHLWTSVQSAITLALAKGREGGRHLGRITGISAGATIGGLGVALLFAETFRRLSLGSNRLYNLCFLIAACSIFASAVLCMMLSTHAHGGQRQRIVVRREYALYYLLIFLEGCRRQIFSVFASFALILVYDVPVSSMLLLQLVNSLLICITGPAIGRLVDRIGERGPLTFYSIGLIAVFLGYATFQSVGALYALFLIDNVLFSFGVGFTTYLNRIVRPGELTPCLAMGTTMNHIAAVAVPYGGAMLWQTTRNYQLPFWVGVGVAAVSMIATRWLPAGKSGASAVQPKQQLRSESLDS